MTRVLTNTYNGNGQLHSIHDSATGQTLRCVYDNLGRLISVDSDDVRESYTYNVFNQLTQYSFASPILGNGTQTYTYDTDSGNSISDGMLRGMTMVNSHGIGYLYDELQRVSYRHINNGKEGGGMWERYVYNSDDENNTTTSQLYEKRNWLNAKFVTNAFLYAYDGNGNIITETRKIFTVPTSTEATQPDNAFTETVITYTYDDLNQLTGVNHSNGRTESYTYDNAGNILTFNNGTGTVLELFYDDPQWKDLLTKVGENAITYDAIGNPLTYYNGYTFTWAEGRRLQSVTTGENQTTGYLYDVNGLRIQKTNPDGSYIQYHLSNGHCLGETSYTAQDQPQKHIRYTYDESNNICGIGIKNSADNGWTEYYFEKNFQGDVIAVYTATNDANDLPELVASYTYDSWGNILSATGELAEINPFRYRGYYYDAETGFYYLRSRYYNPEIGRFLNADGFTSTGQGLLGYNMFTYCGNNPVQRTDTTGTQYIEQGSGGYPIPASSDGGIIGATWAMIVWPSCFAYMYVTSTTFTAADQRRDQFDIRRRQKETAEVYDYNIAARAAAILWESAPHVHHIVPTGKFSNRSLPTRNMINEMHDKLSAVGINRYIDPHNLIIVSAGTHSRMHTDAYIAHVHSYIMAAPDTKEGVYMALFFLRIEIAAWDTHAGGY